jgi:thiamine biosynthesis protein ThiS
VIAALPRLHAVTDDRVIAAGAVAERAAALARAAGPRLAVHLRSRALGGRDFLLLARDLAAALAPHGSWLAINDRADVAESVRAPLVVMGRGAMACSDVRRVARRALVGRSVHEVAGISRAAGEGADVLVAGAVYRTTSHPGAEPAGTDLVRRAAAAGRPVIAIGGLSPELVPEVIAAGAWGVAAIRALWDAADPAGAVERFLEALPAPSDIGVVINGEARRAPRGTLGDLLASLSLDARAVVVERNRSIVRRDRLASTALEEGDEIELVHFVGGG